MLAVSDYESALRAASGCSDIKERVRAIYELAGIRPLRWV